MVDYKVFPEAEGVDALCLPVPSKGLFGQHPSAETFSLGHPWSDQALGLDDGCVSLPTRTIPCYPK